MHDAITEAKIDDRRVESHMLLQRVEQACTEAIERPETAVTGHTENPPFVLNEHAEKLRATFEDHVRKVYNHGLTRIQAVRHACDVAEETLRNKCERVLDSQGALVYAIQEVDRHTEDMQKSLGDLLVATDQV